MRKPNGEHSAIIVEPFREKRLEQLRCVALIHVVEWFQAVLQLDNVAQNLLRLVVSAEKAAQPDIVTKRIPLGGNEDDIRLAATVLVLIAGWRGRVRDGLRQTFWRFVFVHWRRTPYRCIQGSNVPRVHPRRQDVPESIGYSIVRNQCVGERQSFTGVGDARGGHNKQFDTILAREAMAVQRALQTTTPLSGMVLQDRRVNAGGTAVNGCEDQHRPTLGSGTARISAHARAKAFHALHRADCRRKRSAEVETIEVDRQGESGRKKPVVEGG